MCQNARQDDPTIANEDRLFRRIPLWQLVKDDDTGLARISSGAFKEEELSVDIESVLASEGRTVDTCVHDHARFKLVSITAGEARRYEQAVCRDPKPEDAAHGLILGKKSKKKIHEGLRGSARWVVPPEAPSYEDIRREKLANGVAE